MEMTTVWKEGNSKPLSFHTILESSQETASFPHSHSFGDGFGFIFPQARLTSTSTKVLPTSPVPFVTDMPVRTTLGESIGFSR